MEDERWEQGMPVLDRQPIAVERESSGATHRTPDRIPETAPTPLQRHYINLSAIALLAGAIGITAVEIGVPPSSPIVKLCALVGAPIFVLTTADAALRFYRSARAWMPVDRGRALFRLTWVAVALIGIGVVAALGAMLLFA